jgi:hypothetical protein
MEEKNLVIGLWTIIGIGLVFAAYLLFGSQDTIAASNVPAAAPGSIVRTGTTDDGDVSVDLTPLGITDGHLVFDMAINTHSVDLSGIDLTRAAQLEYNGKKVYADGAPQLGGHHIYGGLTFPVEGTPQSFTVTIKGIPKQQERVFRW